VNQFGGRHILEAEGLQFHRPSRLWPARLDGGPIALAPPPTPPDDGLGNKWTTTLLPAIGSLSMIAFAFIVRSLLYLVVIGFIVVAMVGAGLATAFLQGRTGKRRWQKVQERYRQHLAEAEEAATGAAEFQRDGLEGLYPDTVTLLGLARRREGLWERRPGDDDFGFVRLGRGEVAADRPVVKQGGDGPLAEPEPDLAAAADELIRRTATLREAPVVVPLCQLGTVAVIGSAGPAGPGGHQQGPPLVGSWLASLATFHAPGELRFVGYVPVERARAWDWVKWLPHTRDPHGGDGFGRARRAFTTDLGTFAEQLRVVEGTAEHVVVVVDGYRPDEAIGRLRELDQLMARAADGGVTVVVLVDRQEDTPASCGARISFDANGTATYLEAGGQGRVEHHVVPDAVDASAALSLARALAPLRLTDGGVGADQTDTVRLVELLGVEDPSQLEPERDWLTVESAAGPRHVELLQAVIGRDSEGDVLVLDLKEEAAGGMGPHGILVGATGTGKSELLRSFTASLAARHHPDLLNLLLVDFKGGAAFAEVGDLPHRVGLVTNLADDLGLVDRVQQALTGELERRQELLRAAGNLASIRDYHATVADGHALPPLPYLVVIVDEFGELLTAQPDFIDTFIAIGRLGRSLGMHLLLATQRLDEGRIRGLEPHLRYRLCLRTYTAAESRAVIGNAMAFELPAIPGLGYVHVDGNTSGFKAGLVSLPHRSAEAIDADRLVTPLVRPLSLSPPAAVDVSGAVDSIRRSDLQVLVERLEKAGNGQARQVWLDPLPDELSLADLHVAYPEMAAVDRRGAVLGLGDFPERQEQAPVIYDPHGPGGNLGVVGGPRTGKSTLLKTLLIDLVRDRRADSVQLYIVDLGGGGLFDLSDLPHVGAVIGRGEVEATLRLVSELRALIDERARSSRGGASDGQREWADVFLVIDNVPFLRQADPDLDALITEVATTGLQYGVHVIVSANRWFDIRPQLLDGLGMRLELRLSDPAESGVSRSAAARVPTDRPGRGILRSGHLFQACRPSLGDPSTAGERATMIDVLASASTLSGDTRAPAIAALPERVTNSEAVALAEAAGSASSSVSAGNAFLLGVSEHRSRLVQLDLLSPGFHWLAFGESETGRTTLLRRAVHHLLAMDAPVQVHVVDPARSLLDMAKADGVVAYAANATTAEAMAFDLAALLSERLPAGELDVDQLQQAVAWSGPHHVLVVDDYDLLLNAMGGPFGSLVDLIGQAAGVGFHVLLTRRVSGAQRTGFEPFLQRLRESATLGLLFSGPRDEGPVLGGVMPRQLPPGRAVLVQPRGHPELVQCCLDEVEPS
jgi:DNA segregation ATPase FtsK/SpoIIIE, S-DNA-T family